MLNEVQHGDFYKRFQIPADRRLIKDVAISGNGEPTSAKEFDAVVSLIGELLAETNIPEQPKIVLITNGSLVHRQKVRRGLASLHDFHGQVWFKLDSATVAGRKNINHAAITQRTYINNLLACARLCPTWLQTCLFRIDNQGPSQKERKAYLDLLAYITAQVDLQGVLLYTIARPSTQPEADRLAPLSEKQLQQFAEAVRATGIIVKVSH